MNASMTRFHEKPYPESAYVAVALARFDLPDWYHTGVMHRHSDGSYTLLHLQWHCDLVDEAVDEVFKWAVPNIPPERLRSIAALCRLIHNTNATSGLPYAFSLESDMGFAGITGRLLLGRDGKGFTCATFVLAIFQSAGVPLVDLASWQKRPTDERWQNKILELMIKRGVDTSHLDGVASEIGCVRYRPDEVTAACLVDMYPASFDAVTPLAEQVRNRF
jgi:hypothetical protein